MIAPRITGRLSLHSGRLAVLRRKGGGDCGAGPLSIGNLADRLNLNSDEADDLQRFTDNLLRVRNEWSINAGHRNALVRSEGKRRG